LITPPACTTCAGIYNPSLQALPESRSQHFINSHLSAANFKKVKEALFVFKLQMCNAKCEMRNVLNVFYGIVCKIVEAIKL
jgi:hypothetical protein